MMYTLRISNVAEKALSKWKKSNPNLFKKLIGTYKDCMECHVGSDFLLIWIDAASDMVEIVRIGSHSELFGKKVRR